MSASIASAGGVRARQEPDSAAGRPCLAGTPPSGCPLPPAARSLAARLSTLCSALRSSSLMIWPHARRQLSQVRKAGLSFARSRGYCRLDWPQVLPTLGTGERSPDFHRTQGVGRKHTSTEQKGWDSRLSRCGARTRSPVRL